MKKLQISNHDMKENIEDMKLDYKKTCDLYENNYRKLKNQSEGEIKRHESVIREFKDSIEDLMEVKNHLFLENKKMLAILKKKEQVERQRKHILKSEFREIDRIEKVIDRLQ